jgi:hypothetical protein
MNAAEVIPRHIQRDSRFQIVQLLAERIGQSRKTAKVHSHAQIGPLNVAAAFALRQDLSGELEAAAITLYNRRNYMPADKYINQVLGMDPKNWRMRLYQFRVRVRQEQWADADAILADMLKERPGDVGALHAKGWTYLGTA